MLTEHQKKALHYDSHLSVTANAGAGKTTVLVQRFVEILIRTGEPVSRLVAITFTENAAGELRKKIAEVIQARIATGGNRRERLLLERARDELSSANIGTIHSFCAQLLREYPVEAGVDAAFTVIEGVDRELLLREALRESLESFLVMNQKAPEREEFLYALRLLGRRKILRYLEAWLEKRDVIGRMLGSGGCLAEDLSDSRILDSRLKLINAEILASLDEPSWREALSRLLGSATGRKSAELAGILSGWNRSGTLEEKIRRYQELASIVFTTAGTLRKEWTGREFDVVNSRADAAVLSEHRQGLAPILAALAPPGGNEGEAVLLRCARILLNVYGRTMDLYAGRKAEYGQLDFDDLQVAARDLLRQDEIRRQVAAKLRFIMIDEYQDTDQLQYEIVKLLISDFASGNLFIVGDPKQSIFSFRNAEVRIFEETRRAIHAFSGTGPDPSISLAESFRLLTGLVDFVNRVFSRTMAGGSSRFEVGHNELIRGRSNSAEGRIELLLVSSSRDKGDSNENEGEKGNPGAVRIECGMVARRIGELISSAYTIYDPADETPRRFRFSDAAILLRGRTHLEDLEQALVEHRIPYILSGGIGFYQTQEVLDFLSFFKFLLNREDDVALAALLRSPFFAISDARLFEISRGHEETFWGNVRVYAAGQTGGGVLRAVRILEADLDLAGRLPVPLLVQHIMLQTGWHGIVASLPSGGQHLANVQKLLRIARDFEGKGFHTLFDFVERLKMLTEHEPRESQAPPEVAENCVQVLTVHGAKGLEFPVVFLPFLDQRFRYDSPPYIDGELGIAFKIPHPSEPAAEIQTPFFEVMRRNSALKTAAEEKRIFYVACTRGRDLLVLSGELARRPVSPTYLEWTLNGLGLSAQSIVGGEIALPEAPVRCVEPGKNGGRVLEIMHPLHLSVTMTGRLPGSAPPEREAPAPLPELPELWTDPVVGRIRGESFSATQIKTFLECPTKYYLKYFLGLPESGMHPAHVGEDDDRDEPGEGELEGSLTHLVLRDIFSPGITDREIEERAHRLTFSLPGGDSRRTAAAVVRNVSNFIRSPFGIEVLSSGDSSTEFAVSSTFGDDYVAGIIDRLYRDGRGNRHLLDYKTDKVSPDELHQRAELYRPQLAVYAWLTHRLYRQERVRASVVFLLHPSVPVHYLFGQEEFLTFEQILPETISRIKSRMFVRKEQLCQTCPYRTGRDCLLPYDRQG